jgi:hypothetical protein
MGVSVWSVSMSAESCGESIDSFRSHVMRESSFPELYDVFQHDDNDVKAGGITSRLGIGRPGKTNFKEQQKLNADE